MNILKATEEKKKHKTWLVFRQQTLQCQPHF